MKKLLVLAVAFVFTMALVAPAVAAVVEKESITVVADNDKKETKKECKDADKKACTDKKADAKACTETKADAKACTGEKSAEAKKACCGEKKAEKK